MKQKSNFVHFIKQRLHANDLEWHARTHARTQRSLKIYNFCMKHFSV